jgi:YfiH family protein
VSLNIIPDWPVPDNVHVFFTTRSGGFSRAPYESLNLALHVGDNPLDVTRNRTSLNTPSEPVWLNQSHSNECLDADGDLSNRQADACFTRKKGRVLAVLVADCLPILFASQAGDIVAVVHAGWRGLANDIIKLTLERFKGVSWNVWFGPAISSCHYEVGEDVRSRFYTDVGFKKKSSTGKYSMDLVEIARHQLVNLGVHDLHGAGVCTACDSERFFSYRRDGVTGRMAGFLWRE